MSLGKLSAVLLNILSRVWVWICMLSWVQQGKTLYIIGPWYPSYQNYLSWSFFFQMLKSSFSYLLFHSMSFQPPIREGERKRERGVLRQIITKTRSTFTFDDSILVSMHTLWNMHRACENVNLVFVWGFNDPLKQHFSLYRAVSQR